MKSYEASSRIEANAEAIWAILADGANYSSWYSGVVGLEGTIGLGNKLKVTSEANPKRAFPVKVTAFTPGAGMTWTGGMPLGLFKGVRTYTLTPQGPNTRFMMREEYTGPLASLIFKSIPDLQPSFEKFANGLKVRAEGQG